MKFIKSGSDSRKINFLSGIKITQKLIGLLVGLMLGFGLIGISYQQVLVAESEAVKISERMALFENGIHEVQVDLLNARQSETEFYLKKYPIYLGKFDARIIVASQNLKGLTTLVKEEQELAIVTKLGEAFERYRESFIQAAESYVEIGLDENTGMLSLITSYTKNINKVLQKYDYPSLDRSLGNLERMTRELVHTEDIKSVGVIRSEIDSFYKLIKKSKLPDKTKLVINNSMKDYESIFNSLIDRMGVLIKQKKVVKQSAKDIVPLFDSLIQTSQNIIVNTRENARHKRNNITTFFIVTIVVIALSVSIGLFFLARSIIKPLRILQETVIRVNEGDLKARTGLVKSDELGQLANAFDKLLDERLASMAHAESESEQLNDSVIELIKAVSHLAQQKDLAVKIPVSEDITGAISDSLNLLAKETAKIMREVQTTSSQVAGVSSLVKKQSDTVISVANTERLEVENTASLLEESVKAMNTIVLDASEANSKAEITIENTENALNTVLSSVEGINSIRSTISETEKRIKRLGERSQEISGIVSLINSIAERTHILALNASMHAASAGEAGRGFAVVADEVQRLAENAREATSEISTVVNNIRVETADTVSIMNKVITQVAEGTQLANQAGKSMRQTQLATTDLVNSVKKISVSSENQMKISKQLLERATKIKLSTEQTGRELEEQTKSTEKLVKYSDDLVSIVSVFKLPEDELSTAHLSSDTQSMNVDQMKKAV